MSTAINLIIIGAIMAGVFFGRSVIQTVQHPEWSDDKVMPSWVILIIWIGLLIFVIGIIDLVYQLIFH